MGRNLAVLVPAHSRRFPATHLDFWPPGARVYLVIETLKRPFGCYNWSKWNLAWQYWSLAKAASLLWCIWIFWPPGVRIYLVSKTLKWPFDKFEGLIGNFSSGRLSLVSLKLQHASAYYLVFKRCEPSMISLHGRVICWLLSGNKGFFSLELLTRAHCRNVQTKIPYIQCSITRTWQQHNKIDGVLG